MSPTSNSPSLDDLFEANRLNLTVNPLDMFRPTARRVATSSYKPLFPDWDQTLSPEQIDPRVPRDYTVNTFFKSPAEVGLTRAINRDLEGGKDSSLSPTATAFSLSEWIEADPFDDANAIPSESPIPRQEPGLGPESVFDSESVLRDLATFDPDFFFEAPSNVVSLDSPAADSLVGNGNVHPLLHPSGPGAFSPHGNPFLDPPPTYQCPQQISTHQQFIPRSVDDNRASHGYTDPPLSTGRSAEQSCVHGAYHPARAETERREARLLRRSQLFAGLPRLIVPQSPPQTFVPNRPRQYQPLPPPPPPPRRSRHFAPVPPPLPPVVNPRPILPQHLNSVPLANPWRIGYRNPWFNQPDVAWYQATDPVTRKVVGYCLRYQRPVPSNLESAAVPRPTTLTQPRPWAPSGRTLLAAEPALPSAVPNRRRAAEEEADGHRNKVVIVQGVPYRRVD
ncbi:hypothetical protein A1O7_05690 [Cladophialophora yegresii CBS 114405]|uniref:Uncharacterized protein n=1 Tax=Cladophialophora yegresii CBS 114405 TaxID=1182544 RepID=W9VZV7_9EURO|nr:uncharacterized protein A1O7_05690 [Cladophialophora yegresii CBS 114405]EXJ58265.1 hypothetical protein A1O7_05690 [Cladophialophora yegresii CBS 114405]